MPGIVVMAMPSDGGSLDPLRHVHFSAISPRGKSYPKTPPFKTPTKWPFGRATSGPIEPRTPSPQMPKPKIEGPSQPAASTSRNLADFEKYNMVATSKKPASEDYAASNPPSRANELHRRMSAWNDGTGDTGSGEPADADSGGRNRSRGQSRSGNIQSSSSGGVSGGSKAQSSGAAMGSGAAGGAGGGDDEDSWDEDPLGRDLLYRAMQAEDEEDDDEDEEDDDKDEDDEDEEEYEDEDPATKQDKGKRRADEPAPDEPASKKPGYTRIHRPGRVPAEDRVAPWGETWWADRAARFDFGETIFAQNYQSQQITADLLRDENGKRPPVTPANKLPWKSRFELPDVKDTVMDLHDKEFEQFGVWSLEHLDKKRVGPLGQFLQFRPDYNVPDEITVDDKETEKPGPVIVTDG